MLLGGPVAGAIVAAIGTTDEREIRGQFPWYGTLYNHAILVISVCVAGMVYDTLRQFGSRRALYSRQFGAALIGATTYLVLNPLLPSWAYRCGAASPCERSGHRISAAWL